MWSPIRMSGFDFIGNVGSLELAQQYKSEGDLFSCGRHDLDSVPNALGDLP